MINLIQISCHPAAPDEKLLECITVRPPHSGAAFVVCAPGNGHRVGHLSADSRFGAA